MNPTISVVIPAYNYGSYIAEAIESVLTQNYTDFELIILNNASPDNTDEVVKKYTSDSRVTYIVNETNIGPINNFCKGIDLASGEYILFLSADDFLLPNALSRLHHEMLDHPEADFVYGRYVMVDPQSNLVSLLAHPGWVDMDHHEFPDELGRLLAYNLYIAIQATLFKADVFEKFGRFKDDIILSDYDYYLELMTKGAKYRFIDSPFSAHRLHDKQESRSTDMVKKGGLHKSQLYLLEKFITQQNSHQFIGYENQIITLLNDLLLRFKYLGGTLSNEDRERALRIKQKLIALTAPKTLSVLADTPLVSVIIPTLNRPELLVNALESLKGQTYRNWEAIVINDGGKSMAPLIERIDSRIVYLEHSSSKGQSAARNIGIQLAKGEVICFLDDDDMFLPEHLRTVVSELKDSEFVYTLSNMVLIKASGENIDNGIPYHDSVYSREKLLVSNFIPINTWGVRKDCLRKAGLFDEKMNFLEDWELLLRISKRTEFKKIDSVTVRVFVRENLHRVTSSNTSLLPETFREIYARHGDLGSLEVQNGRAATLMSFDNPKPVDSKNKLDEDYQQWLTKTAWRERDVQLLVERMTLQWKEHPIIHLVMLLEDENTELLADTIDSLALQYYSNWQLTIISSMPAPDPIFAESDSLNWLQFEQNQGVYEAINMVISQIPSDWISYVKPGVKYEPHSLASLVDYINLNTQWHLIYTDDDCVDSTGKLSQPRFKPSINLDLLRSSDYIGDVWVKTTSLQIMGGIQALPNAENYDLTLRGCDFFGIKAVGHIENILTHQPSSNLNHFDSISGTLALEQHLERNGVKAMIHEGLVEDTFRVEYLFDEQPTVSIIIPNKNCLDLLEACVESLFEKTAYPNFDVIIVDNGSDDTDIHLYYSQLLERFPERLEVLKFDKPYNFSAMNNMAAAQAKGEYLLLLNNDTQIIQEDWLSRMVHHGQREDVGIVGAKLIYPNSANVQHAGVVLGMNQVASHFQNGISMNESGYCDRAMLDQDYSAVTAACMLIRKSVFDLVSGFDEDELAVLFNDVDFCLKTKEHGYRVIWTPYALVLHHGSVSLRGNPADAESTERVSKEYSTMWRKWLPLIINDPFYNRHLRLHHDGLIELNNRAAWDTRIKSRLRVLGLHNANDSEQVAVTTILEELDQSVILESGMVTDSVNHIEVARMQADTLVVDGDLSETSINLIEECSLYQPSLFKVFVLKTDNLQVSMDSTNTPEFKLSDETLQKLALYDRVIVQNKLFEEKCKSLTDVVVIPELFLTSDFNQMPLKYLDNDKPRIAWVMESYDESIIDMMTRLITKTSDKIDWIVIGNYPKLLSEHLKESYVRPKGSELILLMSSLKLNLMVCPTLVTPLVALSVNRLALSTAMVACPVIASVSLEADTEGVTIVDNDLEVWLNTIDKLTSDLAQLQQQGRAFREYVQSNYTLDTHLSQWAYALTNKPDLVTRGIDLAQAALNGS